MNLTGVVPQFDQDASSQSLPVVRTNSPIDNITDSQSYGEHLYLCVSFS